jgi:UDP-N-acetylglucosamine--N-acetylmuramyl-(pentapeptide) pyrophosphoryl-undecaprenol N-acetylglucosamine transferase
MDRLRFSGMRGKGALHAVGGAFRLLKALWDSARFLRLRGAAAVLGMGGYVCLPGGLMAALLRKPLVLVNADAALLMSNRALRPVARRLAFGFDGPAAQATPRSVVTGNPVRREIEAMAPPAERFAARTGPLRVLVVGGSLGAQVLNEAVPAALSHLPAEARPLVTHQTGAAHFEAVRGRYATLGVQAEVLPFIDNMDQRLAECDLMLCRAGAITVSELCAAGVASVLVPLVVSTTSHQRDNAVWMAERGAAVHLPQGEAKPQRLAELLSGLDRPRLLAMAEAARALAQLNSAGRVADEIEALVAAK